MRRRGPVRTPTDLIRRTLPLVVFLAILSDAELGGGATVAILLLQIAALASGIVPGRRPRGESRDLLPIFLYSASVGLLLVGMARHAVVKHVPATAAASASAGTER